MFKAEYIETKLEEFCFCILRDLETMDDIGVDGYAIESFDRPSKC